MTLRTVASFVAYQANVGETLLPAIARGAQGVVTLAAPDSTYTSTPAQPLTMRTLAPLDLMSNVHGVVEAFRVDVPTDRPGVWFTSGDVSTFQMFEEGRKGEPGANSVPTDEAIAANLSNPTSATAAALGDAVAEQISTAGADIADALQQGRPFVYVKPTGEDSTAVLQAALDNVANYPVIILQRGGVYKLSSTIQFFEGTTLIGNGATLRRMHNSYLMINGVRGTAQFGYTNNGNIQIYDVDLDQNGVENPTIASTVCFVHGHHFHFERVRWLNTTSHAYEMNSSYHVRVIDCEFLGYKDVKPGSQTEALQLDISTPGGQSAFIGGDMTPCKDVVIRGCTFAGFEGLAPSAYGIGAHKSRIDRPQEDIIIEGCDFQGLAKWCIQGFHWNNVTIENNKARDCLGFAYLRTPPEGNGLTDNTRLADGTQTGASTANYGYHFVGNTAINMEQAIYFDGMATGKFTDTVIQRNRFLGTNKVGAYGVWGSHVVVMDIDGNSFNRFERAIHLYGGSVVAADMVTIGENNVRGASDFGIYLSGAVNSTIAGNAMRNNGTGNTSNGSHICITGVSANNGITGNNCSASSTSNRAVYGIYIVGTATRTLHANNILYGAAVTPVQNAGTGTLAGLVLS